MDTVVSVSVTVSDVTVVSFSAAAISVSDPTASVTLFPTAASIKVAADAALIAHMVSKVTFFIIAPSFISLNSAHPHPV